MMNTLRLSLLGSPHLVMGSQPLHGFATNKAQALLYYLAVTGQPHSRDQIATLLWDEMTDTQAKKNLRTVLPDLRRLLNDHLLLDRQMIAFQRNSPYWLDVEVFRRDLAPGQTEIDLAARQAVVDLYQGEFLSGFFVHNAPAFDAWMVGQREELHTLLVMALGALVNDYAQGMNLAAAIAVNRRLLGLEPWSEPAHRQQMLLLAQMGERSSALAQYETCQRILAAEFGVAPLPETTGLYEQIRTGEIGQSATTRQPYNVNAAESTMPRTPEQLPPLAEQPVAEVQVRPQPLTQVDGYNLPQATKLFGRQSEMVSLQKWIVEDGCRLVGIFGIGGQGKSTLAATLVHRLAELKASPQAVEHAPGVIQEGIFARIIWESLLNAPPLSEVIQKWLYLLSDQSMTTPPSSLDEQFSLLLAQLRGQRCLLILDNLESILQSDEPSGDDRSGYYRPGYEAYGQLIRHLALGEHRSCLLITSRERPQNFAHLEEDSPAVRFWNLAGLRDDAGQQMMAERGVVGNLVDLATLSRHYSGNPLALKLAADTIDTLFDGSIAGFLQADTFIFDDIRDVLDQQFARLAPLEREIMTWLAIVREPIAYTTLRGLLAQPPAPRLALEAIRSLQRRSLLEKYEDGFALQNVVLEYATEVLVDGICAELMPADQDVTNPNALPFLNRYALILAQAKEYVRASQTRLLLQPVCDRLLTQLGIRGSAKQLQTWLAYLRDRQPTPGYAAANLLHLLLQLGVDLRGYDFSQLYLRQLYLRGVTLPQVNFAKAEIVESVFTEPFGIVYTVVFSPDGQYLAAGTSEGAIYLWRTADQQLVQVIQAHSQSIYDVAFVYRIAAEGKLESDHQLLLASASVDKSVALWSLVGHEPARWYSQLSHEQQDSLLAIAFDPNSQRVMTADDEGQVFVWDVQSPTNTHLVQHFANTPTRLRLVAFSRDGKTVVVGNRNGTVQWRELTTGDLMLSLTTPTGLIDSLALSHNGQFLVTGGKEGHICLWALPAGELLQVVETKAGIVDAIAFSTDDKMITSSHTDRAVRVWHMDDQHRLHLHHTLLGHRQVVWTVAFGLSQSTRFAGNDRERHPEARHLIASGGSDQTVRVWDAETGQALYTLRGQPRALAYFAISPLPKTPSTDSLGPAWLLVAVGYDRLVHVWQGRDNQVDNTYRFLRNARSSLYTVAISPDGRKIASAGGDESIDMWDVASGQLLKTFHGHTNSILMVAFHPHQEMLASASSDGTVRLWSLHKVEQAGVESHPTMLPATSPVVYDLAFSPDGRVLACAGAELTLRFWDVTESQPTELIAARKRVREASEQDIFAVAFSPDGKKLACGGNNVLHLWDLPDDYFDDIDQNTGQDIEQVDSPLILRHHTTWIYSIAFSPDSTLLASCSADCTVCLWDAASGNLRHILIGHTEAIFKVAFNLDGATVLSCSFDGTIKFWDVQTGVCVNTLAVDGPYAGMNIHEMTGIAEAQKVALKALGAVEQS